MLIINADDYGRNCLATNNILLCHNKERITSASGMMFMADSERSAKIAVERWLDVGLHLNFTEQFSGDGSKPAKLIEYQGRLAAFLKKNKYMFLIYNPAVRKCFDYSFKAQYEEYERLFRKIPSHIDGHQHMHLCANMLLGNVISPGACVRRNFSFFPGEKNCLNRIYRHIIDLWLKRRFIVTDFFFGVSRVGQSQIMRRAAQLAVDSSVELMVHPERVGDFQYLASEEYLQMISGVRTGTYLTLRETRTDFVKDKGLVFKCWRDLMKKCERHWKSIND
jgi:predicted glycoside hydrolase/deacetylase ChbG (UPF0249 family)